MYSKTTCTNQQSLFFNLEPQLNQNHPLYFLANKIGWNVVEEESFKGLYCANTGRPAKSIRRMVGLLILKHVRNVSDGIIVEQWQENIYYQYFYGDHEIQTTVLFIPTELVEFQKRIILAHTFFLMLSSSPFTGKERDEETGYGYFGARYMDHELITSFISVDRYADKYPFISPYVYCAWNPLRLIDPNGDSIAVLISEKAVLGNGHMAILVQTDNGEWQLWSKNGEGKSLSEDKSACNNDKPYGTTFSSVQDFLDNQKANSEGHNGSTEPYYTEAYVMPTTKKQDKTICEKMATFMSSYHLLSDNCADAVKKSLKAAGITTEIDPMQGMGNTAKAVAYSSLWFLLTKHMTENVIPVTIYRNIKEANPNGTVCKPRRKV